MAGRHRKASRWSSPRVVALLQCLPLIVVAAVLIAISDDVRLVRIGAVVAILGAAVPALVRADAAADPSEIANLEHRVRRLHDEVARLGAALAAAPAALPASPTVEPTTTTLSLPLVRAALQVPVQTANGHQQLIDVTDEALAAHD